MITVTRTAEDRWTARGADDAVAGELRLLVRPDDRCYALLDGRVQAAYGPLLDAAALAAGRDVYVEIDEDDATVHGALAEHGFTVNRREHVYQLPTAPTATQPPSSDGFGFISAADAALERFSNLDQRLRRDVPGVGAWRSDPEVFRRETFDDPQFDPATYLIALDDATGEYAGLVRVWMRPGGPRLGLIGVLPAYRRRGLARALIDRAFAALRARGEPSVVCEVDETNVASNALMACLRAQRIGGNIELVRRRRPAQQS